MVAQCLACMHGPNSQLPRVIIFTAGREWGSAILVCQFGSPVGGGLLVDHPEVFESPQIVDQPEVDHSKNFKAVQSHSSLEAIM